MSWGILSFSTFGTHKIWGILSRKNFSLGDFVIGDFVVDSKGRFVHLGPHRTKATKRPEHKDP